MSAYILFQKDNTISSWARAGYLKSTRQLSRWANGCGQDFSQLRGEQLETHPGNYDMALTTFASGKKVQMSVSSISGCDTRHRKTPITDASRTMMSHGVI